METGVSQQEDIISLIIFFGLLGVLLALSVVFIFTYSKKRLLDAEIKRSEQELQHKTELLHAVLMAQEEERRDIARDLHDDIGSTLNIIYQNATRAADAQSSTLIDNVVALTTKAIQNTRNISHKLLPPELEGFGLAVAIKSLLEEVEAINITVQHELSFEEEKLNSDEKLHLFRITQELINNTLKYAKATEIGLTIIDSKNGLYYSYNDNGIGFDASKNFKGLGLKNIENRAEMINAGVKFKSEAGQGMSVLLLIKQTA